MVTVCLPSTVLVYVSFCVALSATVLVYFVNGLLNVFHVSLKI